ncbi:MULTISPECIES: hypothetical protein [Cohnella]|uniref:ATP-dependent DNA ligase n=1 Tax=Cohnella TaxID=329857 RepID=UPI0009BB7A8D|nr:MULTISPECIES: hypothetical protein [Cohnella]MBN2984947.1 ATP-dependent DNA ligase [Cohnella algarum]
MFIPPMPLEPCERPFDDDRYLFEPKIDGRRLILSMENRMVKLYTRNRFDVTRQYPELHFVPIDDGTDTVLDGEVASINPDTGMVELEEIVKRLRMKKPMSIREASVGRPVRYFVFDILRYKGEDVRAWPLTERKALLSEVLGENRFFGRIPTVDGAGTALFEAIRSIDLEGIVAKRKESLYDSENGRNWLKIINYKYATVSIVGYRKNQFGWLAQENGRDAGVIELGIQPPFRQAFYGVSKAIRTGEDRDYVYVRPVLQAVVRFRHRNAAGKPVSPEFVRFAG